MVKSASNDTAVICFDMENVIALPRANISSFFYKRKLNLYNLTCHLSLGSYCAIWTEGLAGRGANHIESGLITALDTIVKEYSSIKHLILWSDSCMPQNRNSIISYALLEFMQHHSGIETVQQKFCEPGHSSIQEVDNIHSHIENRLKNTEVFSPISVVQQLLKVNFDNPLNVIQMKANDFKNFKSRLSNLPSKVCHT